MSNTTKENADWEGFGRAILALPTGYTETDDLVSLAVKHGLAEWHVFNASSEDHRKLVEETSFGADLDDGDMFWTLTEAAQ